MGELDDALLDDALDALELDARLDPLLALLDVLDPPLVEADLVAVPEPDGLPVDVVLPLLRATSDDGEVPWDVVDPVLLAVPPWLVPQPATHAAAMAAAPINPAFAQPRFARVRMWIPIVSRAARTIAVDPGVLARQRASGASIRTAGSARSGVPVSTRVVLGRARLS